MKSFLLKYFPSHHLLQRTNQTANSQRSNWKGIYTTQIQRVGTANKLQTCEDMKNEKDYWVLSVKHAAEGIVVS